jgi:hypothetical protein
VLQRACDSHRVSAGRGIHRAAVVLAALACLSLIPAASAAGSTPKAHSSKDKPKSKFVFLKARVGSDGYVTPGQLETISVSRMAPRAAIRVFLEAPPTTIQCGELYFCDPAPAVPAPGAPPFMANRKGRAVLTFVMPDSYFLETDPFDPTIRQPVAFADQQRIHIDVEGSSTIKHVKRQSFGFARVGVVRPPS